MLDQTYPAKRWLRLLAAVQSVDADIAQLEELGDYASVLLVQGTGVAARRFPKVQERLDGSVTYRRDLADLLEAFQRDPNLITGPRPSFLERVWRLAFPPEPDLAGPRQPNWLPAPALGRSGGSPLVETGRRGHREPLPGDRGWVRKVAAPTGPSCLIEVEVTDPHEGPRPDVPVLLSLTSEAAPRRELTDEYGLATFLDVPTEALGTASVLVGQPENPS